MSLNRRLPAAMFWMLMLVGILNLAIVILRITRLIARHGDSVSLMSSFTVLLAVVLIFVCYARRHNGLEKLGQENGEAQTLRLQSTAYTMAFMAYVAIQSQVFH